MPVLSTFGAAAARAFGAFRPANGAAGNFFAATGGTITTSGNYKYHTFTSSGNFVITNAPAGKYLDYLIVAGGGSSSSGSGGGGGVIKVVGNYQGLGSYPITIGPNGNYFGYSNGGDSFAFGLTAVGGGRGGIWSSNRDLTRGYSGGSGGGGGVWQIDPVNTEASSGGAGVQPTSTNGGLGNNGASGTPPYTLNGVLYGAQGGYGGGAGGAAIEGSGGSPGPGIIGTPLSDNYYGGGGGTHSITPDPYTYNSGYGGGAGNARDGIVIIRYLYQ